jgi:hypothetical protein
VLVFRRENGKRSAMFAFGGLSGLALSALAKVDGASLFDANGDMVTATKQRTVEKSVREICGSIPQTVTHQQVQSQNAPIHPRAEPVMAPVQPVVAEPADVAQVAVTAVSVVADTSAPVVTPAVYHLATPEVQEVSVADAAKRNKQHAACLKLAADNPSINMPIAFADIREDYAT